MSPECKAEITRDQNRMAQDYRLNWRLNKACTGDITRLCAGLCNVQSGQTCGGVVLQCLQVCLSDVLLQASAISVLSKSVQEFDCATYRVGRHVVGLPCSACRYAC